MDRETLRAVLERNVLLDGTPWTLPIVLQVDPATNCRCSVGDRVALSSLDGTVYSVLDITERFELDPTDIVHKWYGTSSSEHPGASRLLSRGSCFLSGPISFVRHVPSPCAAILLTPANARFLFEQNGWDQIVGVQGQIAVGRAREYTYREALGRIDADGLLLSSTVHWDGSGDYHSGNGLAEYHACIESGIYPKDRTVLSGYSSQLRYAGPREAVFNAICHKNMGCSHFVVDVGAFNASSCFSPHATRKLFDDIGGIGVEPIYCTGSCSEVAL